MSRLPSRYSRVPGGEGGAAVGDDQSADQSEGAAAVGPPGAEEDRSLAAGETQAAHGAGPPSAGAGVCVCVLAWHGDLKIIGQVRGQVHATVSPLTCLIFNE